MMRSVLCIVGIAAVIFVMGCGDDNGVNSGNRGGGGPFINPRDGQPYRKVVIGDKTWMAENLNSVTANSWCYADSSSNCDTYGRLYTWDAARTACPSGWRLPTIEDWRGLFQIVGGSSVAGRALKARPPAWNGMDDFGFSALPGGNGWVGSFGNLGSWGYWWSATEFDADNAWAVHVFTGNTNAFENWYLKDRAFSVRCLRN